MSRIGQVQKLIRVEIPGYLATGRIGRSSIVQWDFGPGVIFSSPHISLAISFRSRSSNSQEDSLYASYFFKYKTPGIIGQYSKVFKHEKKMS